MAVAIVTVAKEEVKRSCKKNVMSTIGLNRHKAFHSGRLCVSSVKPEVKATFFWLTDAVRLRNIHDVT